jgi:CRISPR/Cas system-associated endonuclease/helicase Cas3
MLSTLVSVLRLHSKLLYSGENVAISAPTGAGKTALLELVMIRCLPLQQQAAVKMVYFAPTQSSCAEKVKTWTHSFGLLGIKYNAGLNMSGGSVSNCYFTGQEFTGDPDYATMNAIKIIDIMQRELSRRYTANSHSFLFIELQHLKSGIR